MEPRRFAYIDALRGYAILMVIAVHSSQYFPDLPFKAMANQGARGVQLFFVASAITLCLSWRARHDGVVPFYIRRLFRIAPMFYLALAFFLWLRGLAPNASAPHGIGLRHVLMTATFTHGFWPDTINGIVPGSWSIADEMMFYALFPVLIAGVSRVRFATAAAICVGATVAIVVFQHYAARAIDGIADPVSRDVMRNFLFLWFLPQLPCFLFGMVVVKWVAEGNVLRPSHAIALVILSAAAAFVLALYSDSYLFRLSKPVHYAALFATFALGLMHWQPLILVNPVICWIGKVSYSGYLIHLALIAAVPIPHDSYLEAFAILTGATVALSTLTYFAIEEPFNQLGRRVAQRWARPGSDPIVPGLLAASVETGSRRRSS